MNNSLWKQYKEIIKSHSEWYIEIRGIPCYVPTKYEFNEDKKEIESKDKGQTDWYERRDILMSHVRPYLLGEKGVKREWKDYEQI